MPNSRVSNVVDKEYGKTLRGCFGQWSISLWRTYDDLEEFAELKEAFFYLIGKLLSEGRVRFIKPDVDVHYVADRAPPTQNASNAETHWSAPVEEILCHLRERWPANASDFHDADLNAYFYEIPPIVWKGNDGNWVGS